MDGPNLFKLFNGQEAALKQNISGEEVEERST